jgi:hypothetical protein
MEPLTKPNQIRIRIEDSDMDVLDALAGKTLSRTDVASVLLSAAVEAIRKNSGAVHFWPPHLKVEAPHEMFQLNEEAKKSKGRK